MSEYSERKEPIFVCGLGRSGTGLISKSLGQSPEIVYIKEAWLIAKLDELVLWHSMLYDSWQGFTPWNEKAIDRKVLISLVSAFYRKLLMLASGGRRFIEKTPEWNVLHLNLLYELFPSAYYILVYRDGRNQVASTEAKKIRQSEVFDFVRTCKKWAEAMNLFEEVQHTKSIKNMMLVRYEDLLLSFDQIFVELCKFVRIKPFKPRSVTPNSAFENLNSPEDFNNRWRSWSDEKRNVFKKHSGSQLVKWRYVASNDSW
jgi:hypothetical protein